MRTGRYAEYREGGFAEIRRLQPECIFEMGSSIISASLIYLWYHLERRIYGLIEYWNARLIAIAEALQPLVRVYGGEDWERDVRGEKRTTHQILVWAISIFAIFAAAAIVGFVITVIDPELRPKQLVSQVKEREIQNDLIELKTEMTQSRQRIRELQEFQQKINQKLLELKLPEKSKSISAEKATVRKRGKQK